MTGRYQAYPEYKETNIDWIGEIPKHWQLKRLKFLAPIVSKKATQKSNPIALENIESKTGKLIPTDSNFEGEGVEFDKGDILFGKLRPYLAKVYLAESNGEAIGDFHVMRPKSTSLQGFLSKLMLTDNYISEVNASTYGTKMPRASWEFTSSILIPTPLEAEQELINEFLDKELGKIELLIEKQEALIKLLNEKCQAVISHAVTKGLDRHVPMKNSGIDWLGEVPKHWSVMQLRRLTTLSQGLQIPQSERFYENSTGRAEYITIKSINAGERASFKEYIETKNARVFCKKDEILLARTGATGEVITNVEGVFHNNFFKVSFDKNKIDRMFLFNLLKSKELKSHLLMLAGTTTIPDLNHGAFLSTAIALPDIEEQISINGYIEEKNKAYGKLISNANQMIFLMKERRIALISAAVTGKIDVRNFKEEVNE